MYTNEMYIGGMSSSLPEDVQEEMYHSVSGLEHAKIVKNAYAIEYDCINPRQLIQRWSLRKLKVFSVAGSLTEVQVTRGGSSPGTDRWYQCSHGSAGKRAADPGSF